MATTATPATKPSRGVMVRGGLVGIRLLAGLILVQAFLAGRHLFGSWSITVHGVVGNAIFALAAAVAVALTLARLPPLRVAAAWLLVALLTAQVGLGYAGRSIPEAAAWHVPLGVAAFGLAVWLSTHPRAEPVPRTTP